MTTSNPQAAVLVANLEPPLKWDSTSGRVKLDANATPIGEYPSRDAAQAAGVKPGSQYVQTVATLSKLSTVREAVPTLNNRFGHSVALNATGTLAAIGVLSGDGVAANQGHVEIYSVSPTGVFTKLYNVGSPSGATSGQFGQSVSLSADGTRLAVGERYSGTTIVNSGRVHLYELGVSSATFKSTYVGALQINTSSAFKAALSGDGKTLAIGDQSYNSSQGFVELVDVTNLTAPVSIGKVWGNTKPNRGSDFGAGVALNYSGTELIVKASYNVYDVINISSKSPFTFTRKMRTNTELYYLPGELNFPPYPPGSVGISGSGYVMVYGNDAVVGKIGVAVRSGDSVLPIVAQDFRDAAAVAGDGFGASVAVSSDGTRILVGANVDPTTAANAGTVYLYSLNLTRALRVMDDMPVTASPVVEAGGFVANAGGTVTLDNITVTSTGAGTAFTLKTVSGTLSYDISGWCTYGANADAQSASSRGALTMTTTAAHPFGWGASGNKGNSYELTIVDRTNSKVYQVTGMVGDATNNAFVKIKRIN